MSDKVDLKNLQTTIKEGETMEETKPKTEKTRRLCSICKQKPTISDSSTYCASCMGRKGNEKQRERAALTPKETKPPKVKENTPATEKVDCRANMEVVVDFTKYPALFRQLQEMSDDQIRPIDSQIIFFLKQIITTQKPNAFSDSQSG